MGRISDDDVRRVRDANDLVGLVGERVVLRQKGRLWWGCCPFHGEKTPSFKIDPATQLWHCFGCGLGGDAYGFVMRSENVDFLDAVRLLAERANIEIQEEGDSAPKGHRERVIAACEAAADFYHEQLTRTREAGATRARDYLGKRGFGSDVAKRWRLGYAPGRGALAKHLAEKGFSEDEIVSANLGLRDGGHVKDRFYERIMFPIGDLRGRCIAFGGRVVGTGEPKYLNTAETPVFSKSRNMFAIDRAKAQIVVTGTAVVVEGYTDVIALHEAGITNAVATLGTSLTLEHVKLLGRFAKRVVYLFDGDAAGMRAADRAVEFVDRSVTLEAGAGRVQLHVAVIPGGLDPADYVAENGADALREVIDGAGELLRFAIDRRLARWDLDRPEERFRALADAAEVLAPLKGSITADDYSAYIADQLSLRGVVAGLDAVRAAVASARPRTAVPTVEPEAVVEEQSEVPAASTPELRAERELLGILIRVSSLRERARFLLSNDLLSERTHKVMAEVVANAGADDDAATITAAIEERLRGAASALSASIVEDGDDADAEETVRALVRKLKEFQLERRIAAGKARLKQRDSFKNDAEYDDLYKVVSTLQVELSQLKLGVIDVEDTV